MKADYGIDAPGVIRNLLLVAVAGILIWATAAAGLWSGVAVIGPVRLALARMLLWPAVGCGRGLMLVGAAKRLTTGRAVGIDIWQAEDLSGNRPEATIANAEAEGVRERVEVETADMRKLPFEDATFDVVVSCAAIHNLYAAGDRAQAIREISRVLRPGGRAVIDDIRHEAEYAKAFRESGCEVRRSGSPIASIFLSIVTFGALRPATLIATRSGR